MNRTANGVRGEESTHAHAARRVALQEVLAACFWSLCCDCCYVPTQHPSSSPSGTHALDSIPAANTTFTNRAAHAMSRASPSDPIAKAQRLANAPGVRPSAVQEERLRQARRAEAQHRATMEAASRIEEVARKRENDRLATCVLCFMCCNVLLAWFGRVRAVTVCRGSVLDCWPCFVTFAHTHARVQSSTAQRPSAKGGRGHCFNLEMAPSCTHTIRACAIVFLPSRAVCSPVPRALCRGCLLLLHHHSGSRCCTSSFLRHNGPTRTRAAFANRFNLSASLSTH